ncbi:MAG: hypothetical protein IIZ88_03535, partial [Prevotella sp.]|nr:hypothetical protein [Prevotella sp.]
IMNNRCFVLKVSLMNEDGSYDYVNVAGLYWNREDAVAKAKEKMERMKFVWPNCHVGKHNNDLFFIDSDSGLRKWYEIQEQVIK